MQNSTSANANYALFIDRLWKLVFSSDFDDKSKLKDARWTLTLSLLADSPPTYVHAQLLIQDASARPLIARGSSRRSRRGRGRRPETTRIKADPRPSIQIPLKMTSELVSENSKTRSGQKQSIVVSLDNPALDAALQQLWAPLLRCIVIY